MTSEKPLVFIVDTKDAHDEFFADFIKNNVDYKIKFFTATDKAITAIRAESPDLIVIDLGKLKDASKVAGIAISENITLMCATSLADLGSTNIPDDIRFISKPFKEFDLKIAFHFPQFGRAY